MFQKGYHVLTMLAYWRSRCLSERSHSPSSTGCLSVAFDKRFGGCSNYHVRSNMNTSEIKSTSQSGSGAKWGSNSNT